MYGDDEVRTLPALASAPPSQTGGGMIHAAPSRAMDVPPGSGPGRPNSKRFMVSGAEHTRGERLHATQQADRVGRGKQRRQVLGQSLGAGAGYNELPAEVSQG